jgi:hypothetical protein
VNLKNCFLQYTKDKYVMHNDWLFIVLRHARIFHLYGDVIIAGEELQKLSLCFALRVFEQEWTFIVPHLLWYGILVYPKKLQLNMK